MTEDATWQTVFAMRTSHDWRVPRCLENAWITATCRVCGDTGIDAVRYCPGPPRQDGDNELD